MGKAFCIAVIVAALSVLLGKRIVNLRERSLAARELVKNHLSNCTALTGLESGSEDITILDNGIAFISTGLKYPGLPTSDAPGRIYYLDLEEPDLIPVELPIDGDLDLDSFNPHGISVFINPDDRTVYLFVVNHPQQQSQVEVFKFPNDEDIKLVHLKTIKHKLLHSVNDIVAVGVDTFYATNDHYFTHEILKLFLEPILSQPWTNVVFYSPYEVKVVSEGYYFANGINISPDKNQIYVADLLDHNVHVLNIKDDNSLERVKSVAVGSLCDNIEVDSVSGDLLLGCHPNGWKAIMMDPEDPPGSEVIHIRRIDSYNPIVTQLYMDDGHVLMGSSVAAAYEDKLLIGTAIHKALCCDFKVDELYLTTKE